MRGCEENGYNKAVKGVVDRGNLGSRSGDRRSQVRKGFYYLVSTLVLVLVVVICLLSHSITKGTSIHPKSIISVLISIYTYMYMSPKGLNESAYIACMSNE